MIGSSLMIAALLSGQVMPMPEPCGYPPPLDFFIRANGDVCRDFLHYDDGSAYWLLWDGIWRGTWFDVTDFDPLSTRFLAVNTQYWFYHHSSYPWDISAFYAELWNGTVAGPETLLDRTSVTALHYAPASAIYNPSIWTDTQFWAVVNTTMSGGGWPSVLADNSPNPVAHSFCSDDFLYWAPWPEFQQSLERSSWAEIKGLFR